MQNQESYGKGRNGYFQGAALIISGDGGCQIWALWKQVGKNDLVRLHTCGGAGETIYNLCPQ